VTQRQGLGLAECFLKFGGQFFDSHGYSSGISRIG
jgi:hypothetical protein